MFADTSGWACFVDRKQSAHALAGELVRTACDDGIRVVTTNYVLAELTALLNSPLRISKDKQIAYLEAIRSADWVEVVHLDGDADDAAWRLWESRPDKTWTFVDCSSFVVMEARGLTDALTTDHHFEQAGFNRLLK